MCCFAKPVNVVNATQIFARLTTAGTQFLVYQMHYDSETANAMILPLPIKAPVNESSLRFINLESYPGFFQDLNHGFPGLNPFFAIGCGGPHARINSSMLQVHEVGSFEASFVPTLADFSRLDPRFCLPNDVWSQIPQYANYGFAVFQLAAGSLKPHPMAFEFAKEPSSIFFPTLHIHDGEIHELEEFDHLLYLQHAGIDSRVGSYVNADVRDSVTQLIRSQYPAKYFCDVEKSAGIVSGGLLIHRQILKGPIPNRDIEISTAGDPLKPSINIRPLLSFWPWLLVVGALLWLIGRRNRIRESDRRAEKPQAG